MTLNRKSEGQGHRERSQFRRSHQGLFPCKVSSLYWLMWPRTNLNAEVNQNVDTQTDRQTDRQTDGRTDRRTSSIHKPESLCNPAKNGGYIFHYHQSISRNCFAIRPKMVDTSKWKSLFIFACLQFQLLIAISAYKTNIPQHHKWCTICSSWTL